MLRLCSYIIVYQRAYTVHVRTICPQDMHVYITGSIAHRQKKEVIIYPLL